MSQVDYKTGKEGQLCCSLRLAVQPIIQRRFFRDHSTD